MALPWHAAAAVRQRIDSEDCAAGVRGIGSAHLLETGMADVIGTFEDIVALAPKHEAVLRALRALAVQVHPDHVEVARPGDRAVSWGWGPKKMSEAYAYALPYKNHVNLGFYRGADLPDPEGRLKGTGKAMRNVSIRSAEEVADPALRALIVAAREERRAALGLGIARSLAGKEAGFQRSA